MAQWIFHNKTLINANTVVRSSPVFHETVYFLPNTNANIKEESSGTGRVFYSGRTVIPASYGYPFLQPFVYTGTDGLSYPNLGIILPDFSSANPGTFSPLYNYPTTHSSGYKSENDPLLDYNQWFEFVPSKGHIIAIKDTFGTASVDALSGIYILDSEEKRRIEGRSGLAIYEPYGYAVVYWNGVDNWHVISKKGVSGWG